MLARGPSAVQTYQGRPPYLLRGRRTPSQVQEHLQDAHFMDL